MIDGIFDYTSVREKHDPDQVRPRCINHGCNEPVTYSRTDKNGKKRWRPHCSHCQAASYGSHEHRPGVSTYRTGKCANQDGRLGFTCAIDYSKEWAIGHTEVDHINTDPSDNRPENLMELCQLCHKEKGKRNGDFNQYKTIDLGDTWNAIMQTA